MKLFSASKIAGFAAISSLALAACMSTNHDSEESQGKSMSQSLKATDLPLGGLGYAVGLSKKAVTEVAAASAATVDPTQDGLATSKAALQAAGVCQGLIGVIDDLSKFSMDLNNDTTSLDAGFSFAGYPNLQRMVTCILPWVEKAMNVEATTVTPNFGDMTTLSDCICNGSGSIFGIYEGYVNTNWKGFSPVQSTGNGFTPATSAGGFNASAAQTIGNGFSPSSSPMGNGFNAVTP